MKDVISLFQAARCVSTPLVAISTSDQFALTRKLFQAVGNGESPVPKLTHDIMRGLVAVNDAAKEMLAEYDQNDVMAAVSPPGMLALAQRFHPGTLTVMYNAHRFVDDVTVAQGIANLRNVYCEDRRTLVLVGPAFQLPPELQDVVLLDEAMPDDEQLKEVLFRTYENAYETIANTLRGEWVDAVRGLSAFTAEQVFAMSLTEDGVDIDDLWERKRAAINQTRGLKFVRGGPSFDDLGGLDAFKGFMRKMGKQPGVIVFMDEIDKSIAGAQGDTSGVSQDFHGTLLSWMEDNFHDGMIAVGPPGSGKTAGGMAIGSTLGIPTIVLDINGMKGSLVGESERSIREALKVVDSVAGKDGAFVFATCNSERQLAPEFKRRFRSGMWFFDLPTQQEREVIWKIHMGKYDLSGRKYGDKWVFPRDDGWTGAEIRNCCDLASRMNCSLADAAQYVVPLAKANPRSVDALRNAAYGKWLSASYPGPYKGVPQDDGHANESYRRIELSSPRREHEGDMGERT